MKLNFFPMPENIHVLNPDVTYVVIDDTEQYHIATFDGTDLIVVAPDGTLDEEITIDFLAALPSVEKAVLKFSYE